MVACRWVPRAKRAPNPPKAVVLPKGRRGPSKLVSVLGGHLWEVCEPADEDARARRHDARDLRCLTSSDHLKHESGPEATNRKMGKHQHTNHLPEPLSQGWYPTTLGTCCCRGSNGIGARSQQGEARSNRIARPLAQIPKTNTAWFGSCNFSFGSIVDACPNLEQVGQRHVRAPSAFLCHVELSS